MAEDNQSTIASINKAMNQYNLLQVRLDTSQIMNEIKMFLNAEIEIVTQTDDGKINRNVISIGKAKANKEGINSILNWLQLVVNPQAVQGNFSVDKTGFSEKYEQYIEDFQKNLSTMLMVNLYNYNINEDEYEGIIDGMMNLIIPFMSRLIGNKERESYGETFKEITSSSMSDRRKIPLMGQ